MKPPHHHQDFILEEDVLVKMLRIVHSIAQDLEKLGNKKSLPIKQTNEFNEVVHDDASYKDNVIEKNNVYIFLVNVTPSKRSIDWPFTSTLTSQYPIIDLEQPPQFDDLYWYCEMRKGNCSYFF